MQVRGGGGGGVIFACSLPPPPPPTSRCAPGSELVSHARLTRARGAGRHSSPRKSRTKVMFSHKESHFLN